MTIRFDKDLNQVHITNDRLVLTVATGFGPRITAFSEVGSTNVLAELGDAALDLPDGRSYKLHGGHRLWIAPESPDVTYEPDDEPVVVTEVGAALQVVGTGGVTVGIEKKMIIRPHAGQNTVSIVHTLTNTGDKAIDVAPWAITQLPVGGTALIPLARKPVDPHGLQANAAIVVWPYTGVEDNPFVVENRMIMLEANRTRPTKVGTSLDRGWLAYVRDDSVFVKRAQHSTGGRHVDLGATAQCYCDSRFVELETLGSLATLSPGASTSHEETWELHRVDPGIDPHDVPELLKLDGGIAK
ncbi:MAG: hypothetical protein GXP34_06160 [Actinobacteria bacterium]|nr:hypothetical protein [Actinomycetota bacterium]